MGNSTTAKAKTTTNTTNTTTQDQDKVHPARDKTDSTTTLPNLPPHTTTSQTTATRIHHIIVSQTPQSLACQTPSHCSQTTTIPTPSTQQQGSPQQHRHSDTTQFPCPTRHHTL